MIKSTGKFIKSIIKKRGKAIVDDEIPSEAKKMINEEMSEKRQELKTNIKESEETNLREKTTAISGVMEEIYLEALKKLGKTEIDKQVLAEVEKMVEAERLSKRQVLKGILKDNLT